MNKLIEKARTMNAEQLVNAAREVNNGEMSEDKRMVRAALIQAYAEKCGVNAADLLMDELGM